VERALESSRCLEPRREALAKAFFAALEHQDPDTILEAYREATRGL
jgi:hypothetical protein